MTLDLAAIVLCVALAAAVSWALIERMRFLRSTEAVRLDALPADEANADLSSLLDALPMPIWSRDRAGALNYANAAFLRAVGCADRFEAASRVLEPSELDLFAEALDSDRTRARRFVESDGQRQTLEFQIRPTVTGEAAAIAIDVTPDSLAHSKVVLESDAHRDVIEQLKIGVAVFGPDRRFLFANMSFRTHYGLSDDARSDMPYFEELLDRLRADGKLPEQRDFASWKRRMVALFGEPRTRREETWHLPNGRSDRLTICPHASGGLTIFVEDLTSELELRSAYNAIVKTQKATLDAIGEAIAVFGPDGRLRLHNAAFTRLWKLGDFDLAKQPHLRQIASACESRIGRDDTWALVVAGVNAGEPDRYNSWNAITRADGRALVVSLTRLPDGATMATFSDLSDVYPGQTARDAA